MRAWMSGLFGFFSGSARLRCPVIRQKQLGFFRLELLSYKIGICAKKMVLD